jgi:hypothetical protein
MAKVERNEDGLWNLQLSDNEIDVVYRLLRLAKQNEENTRLPVARDILVAIRDSYAALLDYDTDHALTQDHFGSVVFTGSKN